MSFDEANTIRDGIRDHLQKIGWEYVPRSRLPRSESDVLVEPYLREALIRLNPEIAARPDRADEIIYKLRTILLSVQSEGLVRSNERFAEIVCGGLSMPFGENYRHVPVTIIDFVNPESNHFVTTTEYSFAGAAARRADNVLLVNGIPLVVGECKTPTRPAVTWLDAARQIHEDYEQSVPALFVPNVFSFATEGKTFYYGAVRAPPDIWAPWREEEPAGPSPLADVIETAMSLLAPETVLDILKNFSLFATDKKNRKIKVICRHQQYDAANKIVQRVADGRVKKGLIWHFQGSGKSFLMVFAAQKLRLHPALKNPTVIVVVDRTDLDTQISATFNAADIPNTVNAASREDLHRLLAQDTRKVIITTIHKFAEAGGVLNTRSNIILLCDEAHRTQEGDLGQRMREALPNAFLFGLTGTPINEVDRNTFRAFGAAEDANGYLSIYSPEDALRDRATLPLHFEPRLIEYHIDRESIDAAFDDLTDQLEEDERSELTRRAARMVNFIHNQERVEKVAEDIVKHFQQHVEPNGYKAMVVCYDRQACVQYKQALDLLLATDISEIVMTLARGDPDEWKQRWERSKDDEERLLDRFRDPLDSLQILIVTSKLLTGFDAPILQTMYLDKLMKNHTLLQAICRTNRPFQQKSHGLIVDYIGVFDEVAAALAFDEQRMRNVITNVGELKKQLPQAIADCLAHFPGVDIGNSGWEGLIAAQECIPTNERRDAFAADYGVLAKLWEAISPDPYLAPHKETYRWLTQVYESVRPVNIIGPLLWQKLGAKTVEIINENVHVVGISDDFDEIVIDEDTVRDLLDSKDPKKGRRLEIRIIKRLRKHAHNPVFIQLGERLELIKERYEQGFIDSLDYLRQLIQLARDVVEAEKQVEPLDARKKAKAALTELFEETRTDTTPVIIERIVNDIDSLVRAVRFEGWQQSNPGEREVKKALRKALRKYQLQQDQDLFDRAYEYIRQYY